MPSWRKPTADPVTAYAVLVGESNPYSDDPDDALLPWPARSAGAHLLQLLGWSQAEYLASFTRVNLVAGADWDLRRARHAAQGVLLVRHYQTIIMLGARVASAFRCGANLWENEGRLWRVPHPSRRCREWNDPAAAHRLRTLLEPFRLRLPAAVRP